MTKRKIRWTYLVFAMVSLALMGVVGKSVMAGPQNTVQEKDITKATREVKGPHGAVDERVVSALISPAWRNSRTALSVVGP